MCTHPLAVAFALTFDQSDSGWLLKNKFNKINQFKKSEMFENKLRAAHSSLFVQVLARVWGPTKF